MKKNILLLLFGLLVVARPLDFLQAQQKSEFLDDSDSYNYLDELKQKYLSNSKSLMIYSGSHELSSERTVNSDVLLLNGDLIIRGTLNGKAVVANGNIILKDNGRITKDAVAINGKVVFQDVSRVSGNVIQLKGNHSGNAFDETVNSEGEDTQEAEAADLPLLPKEVQKWTGDKDSDEQMSDESTSGDDIDRVNERMKARMERFNKKMKQWKYKVKSSGDGYSYSTDENSDDQEEDRGRTPNHTYDASFVRVDDDYQNQTENSQDDNNENANVQATGYNYYGPFLKKHPGYVNTSFVAFDYNRVDGLFLGLKLDRNHKIYDNKPFQIYGGLGYAFSEKAVRFQLGLDKFWGDEYRFAAGAELHDVTNTQDDWRVGQTENAVNALLFKNDFRDYFRTKGYSLQVSQNLNSYLKLAAIYRADDYTSLTNRTRWAVFFPNQDFRVNPLIDNGTMRTVTGQLSFNTAEKIQMGKNHVKRVGWNIFGEAERSYQRLNSDFQFTRYQLSVTRYQPLSRWENLDVRLMAGTATGTLPLQKTFYLGGISTLRGFDYKEFSGNNLVLVNVEYRISSGILKNDRIFFLRPFSAILFMDTGYAWNHPTHSIRKTFAGAGLHDVQTDIGIGLGDEKDLFRVDIAKPLSRKNGDYKIDLRVNYAF